MKYFRVGGSPPPSFSLRHTPSSCWNIIVSTITIINVFINIINIADKDNIILNIVNMIETVNNILLNLLLLFIHSEPLKSIPVI